MIKYLLSFALIFLSIVALPYCLGHWNVSYTVDQFETPQAPVLTEKILSEVPKEELIDLYLSIHRNDKRYQEMDKRMHFHLRNSVLILSFSVVMLSVIIIYFMAQNFKLKKLNRAE